MYKGEVHVRVGFKHAASLFIYFGWGVGGGEGFFYFFIFFYQSLVISNK